MTSDDLDRIERELGIHLPRDYRALVLGYPAGLGPSSPARATRTRMCMSERRIVGFRLDPDQEWIADLECGHAQHVRHVPPWQLRPWVVTPEGRAGRIGSLLPCRQCDETVGVRDR